MHRNRARLSFTAVRHFITAKPLRKAKACRRIKAWFELSKTSPIKGSVRQDGVKEFPNSSTWSRRCAGQSRYAFQVVIVACGTKNKYASPN
jgi:hypothetical protein